MRDEETRIEFADLVRAMDNAWLKHYADKQAPKEPQK